MLAQWFAERFAVQHPREAQQFVQRHAHTLNPALCEAIAFHLSVRLEDPPKDILRVWSAALVTVAATPERSLMRLLRKCAGANDLPTTLALFRSLLRPRLRFDPTWTGLDSDAAPALDVKISLGGETNILREVTSAVSRRARSAA